MRVTRAKAEENRRTVLESAGKLFRERGFDGVGVAEVMKAAGLTHGAFYGQFASKDDLAAQALAQALTQTRERWPAAGRDGGDEALPAFVEAYLSPLHRTHVADGCPFPALGVDAARSTPRIRRTLQEGLEAWLETLQAAAPGEVSRPKALSVLSTLVGALMLSRAVEDPAFADEILSAARDALNPAGKSL